MAYRGLLKSHQSLENRRKSLQQGGRVLLENALDGIERDVEEMAKVIAEEQLRGSPNPRDSQRNSALPVTTI